MSESDPLEAALTRALDRIAVLELTVATHAAILPALQEALGESGEFARIPFGGVHVKFTRAAHQALERLNDQQRSWLRFRLTNHPRPFVSAADVAALALPDPKPEPAR